MSASLVAMAQRSNAILEEQARYYRARAPEYDDWWYRRGEFAERPHRDEWFADVRALEAAFDDFAPAGDVLELAGGTGLWTARLAPAADALTVVDGSPEMIAINRERVGMRPQMRYVKADIFEWDPPAAAFEACFFGFWLSHVPDDRFAGFWATVARALRPGGRAPATATGRTCGSSRTGAGGRGGSRMGAGATARQSGRLTGAPSRSSPTAAPPGSATTRRRPSSSCSPRTAARPSGSAPRRTTRLRRRRGHRTGARSPSWRLPASRDSGPGIRSDGSPASFAQPTGATTAAPPTAAGTSSSPRRGPARGRGS